MARGTQTEGSLGSAFYSDAPEKDQRTKTYIWTCNELNVLMHGKSLSRSRPQPPQFGLKAARMRNPVENTVRGANGRMCKIVMK